MAAQRHKPIVFVVDDERLITDTLVVILNQMGFSGRAAYSISSAISLLDEGCPDLAITDDNLTDGDGTQLCNEIRRRLETAAVPIIMLGANVAAHALKAGADVVLDKPANPQTIIEWAKKLLANYEDFKRASLRKSDGSMSDIA